MGKNNAFINAQKLIHKEINKILPNIYAAMAMALWNLLKMPDDEKQEEIEDIFAESQAIWFDCADNDKDMLEMCEELTGIDVIRTTMEV